MSKYYHILVVHLNLMDREQEELLQLPSKEDIPRLLRAYEQQVTQPPGELLPLVGKDFDEHGRPYDTYNISAPFINTGHEYIAVRTEPRKAEHQTTTKFFKYENYTWVEDMETPTLSLQDPSVTRINGELVVGGVKTYSLDDGGIGYKMEFYKGRTLKELEKFAEGPTIMKGIRLVQLPDGKIGVFTRPQGVVNGVDYGRGQICYIEIDSLDQLSADIILQAKQIGLQFTNGRWGGSNEAYVLTNGRIGVLFHIAQLDEDYGKHYYAGVFTMDRHTYGVADVRIIATKDDFPEVPNKRPDEEDIIYPGGLYDNKDGTVDLYAGLRDTSAGKRRIPNPFTPELELSQAA